MDAKTKQRIPVPVTSQMNDSWHIPRASLAGSSSNSSNKSNSNPSTVSKNFKMTSSNNLSKNNNRHQIAGRETILHSINRMDGRRAESSRNNSNPHSKRGSRSSQGSSDSNNSSQSTSSGSLLLTAANLERFAEIHRKQNKSQVDGRNEFSNSNYNTNLMLASMQSSNIRKDAVIAIDQNLDFVKTKDLDTVSMASSTHFTMVNGEGGPSKNTTGGICSRGKQVTVLITTMSLFFLFVIIGMVYALELRAREMPKS